MRRTLPPAVRLALAVAAAVGVTGLALSGCSSPQTPVTGSGPVAASTPAAVTPSTASMAAHTPASATSGPAPHAGTTSGTALAVSSTTTAGSGSGSTNAGTGTAAGTRTTASGSATKAVHPTITYAGAGGPSTLQVSALVPGIVEDGGTCTATATVGGRTISASSPASAGPTSTTCGALTLPTGSLPPGIGTVTVAYHSSRAAGTSAPTAVTVNR